MEPFNFNVEPQKFYESVIELYSCLLQYAAKGIKTVLKLFKGKRDRTKK